MSNELINFEYKGVPDPDFKLRYISISKDVYKRQVPVS